MLLQNLQKLKEDSRNDYRMVWGVHEALRSRSYKERWGIVEEAICHAYEIIKEYGFRAVGVYFGPLNELLKEVENFAQRDPNIRTERYLEIKRYVECIDVPNFGSLDCWERRAIGDFFSSIYVPRKFTFLKSDELRLDEVPPWIFEAADKIKDKEIEYFRERKNHPIGHGLSHNIRTGIYAFLFGRRRFTDTLDLARLLFSGLMNDVNKGDAVQFGLDDDIISSITAYNWLKQMQRDYPITEDFISDVSDLVLMNDFYKVRHRTCTRNELGESLDHDSSKRWKKDNVRLGKFLDSLDRARSSHSGGSVPRLTERAKARGPEYFANILNRLATADVYDRTQIDRFLVVICEALLKKEKDYWIRKYGPEYFFAYKWLDHRDEAELGQLDERIRNGIEIINTSRIAGGKKGIQRLLRLSRKSIQTKEEEIAATFGKPYIRDAIEAAVEK